MKRISYLVLLPFLWGCGNKSQNNEVLAPVEVVEECIPDWDNERESATSSNSSIQSPIKNIEKIFEVVADAYRYNPATGNFSSRGEYTLQITLYSDHSLWAKGREGVSMRVQRSLEDKWDYMCAVPGENNYIYFFNTDEIYSY